MVQQILSEERPPSWNVAPMQGVRIVLERAPREDTEGVPVRALRRVRWGLVPSWAKDPKVGSRMINARSETLTSKPSFKAAAARRRCLVAMDGYYEWQKNADGTKTPYFLHADGEELLAAAGLYELWPDPDLAEDNPKKWLWTTTIATTSATDALGHIHDRTPVFIPPDRYDQWLDTHLQDLDEVDALLHSLPEPILQAREVSPAVGAVHNNSPELIVAV
jgi:putative SOS response-associated peptidase YedK